MPPGEGGGYIACGWTGVCRPVFKKVPYKCLLFPHYNDLFLKVVSPSQQQQRLKAESSCKEATAIISGVFILFEKGEGGKADENMEIKAKNRRFHSFSSLASTLASLNDICNDKVRNENF